MFSGYVIGWVGIRASSILHCDGLLLFKKKSDSKVTRLFRSLFKNGIKTYNIFQYSKENFYGLTTAKQTAKTTFNPDSVGVFNKPLLFFFRKIVKYFQGFIERVMNSVGDVSRHDHQSVLRITIDFFFFISYREYSLLCSKIYYYI